MSSLAKPSGGTFRLEAHGEQPRGSRARVDNLAGLADSLNALGQLTRCVTAAARRRLRAWRRRAESRNELRLCADEIVRDTVCSRYDVELELRKPFWRA
jgi:uncharacterized protein YjiS (DUF1127 family)